MKIYFAGRIGREDDCWGDWRQELLKRKWDSGSLEMNDCNYHEWGGESPDLELRDYPGLFYSGPFVEGGGHGEVAPGPHGRFLPYHEHDVDALLRPQIFLEDIDCIRGSDALFAWFDDWKAFGTICEIGIAFQASIPIYIGLLGDIDFDDLWFVKQCAKDIVSAPSPLTAFYEIYCRNFFITTPKTFVRPHFRSLPALHQSSLRARRLADRYGFDLEKGLAPCVTCGRMFESLVLGECSACSRS